jgi:hypothetical protein
MGFMKSFAVAAATISLCGCAVRPPSPATTVGETPCTEARAWQEELRSLPANTLLGVDASYLRDTCSGTAQVAATSLILRRPDGASSARLVRLLQCRSAQIVVRDDTGGLLPDGLVDVDVKADAGNVDVTLRADSVAKNIGIFRRAKALARSLRANGS